MKITSIRLQRFRQFADTTIEVGKFNLLVGPNNCGKTTILHAIRSFFQLMHGHVRFEGNPPQAEYHKRFLGDAGEIAPTPDIKELWFEQRAGNPITISVTFEEGKTFGVSLRQQFGQIHVSADTLPDNLTAADAATHLGIDVAFIPGLVGVLVSEPYAAAARRNALATQGRYSEIFRSSLHQLKAKNQALLDQINKWLGALFGIEVSAVEFDPDADEYVTVKYVQNGTQFDVVSSGAGLQQIIQILTYLYLKQPRILLIDEPDAHLHSKLQARLGDLFRKVAEDLNAQVFLSTHSLDLIDTFSTDEVIVIDSKQAKLSPIGKNKDLVSALVDADVVDVSSLSRLLSSRNLVVVEDKDQTVLKAIDKVCGSKLYSSKSDSYVLSSKGVGKFKALAELGAVLKDLTQQKFNITFVQDRDGMPDFLVAKYIAAQKSVGVTPWLLARHEIENYLLEPALISAAALTAGKEVSADEVRQAILDEAQLYKAEARRVSRECARTANRYVPDKLGDVEIDVQADKWFDDLDLSSLEVIQKVFPGKELLPKVLKRISGDGKQVTKGNCVAAVTKEMMAADIQEMIAKLAEGEGAPAAAEPQTLKQAEMPFAEVMQ